MQAEPQREHAWLLELVGDWTYEASAVIEPGQPPSRAGGSESVRSLGGLWVVAEGQGEMPGGCAATTVLTIGYDPRTKRYVGTWVGSMMTHLWVYDGALDEAGKVLTLSAEAPSFTPEGGMSKYRDVIEIVDDGHRVLRSSVLGEDGAWREFMTAHYQRKR